MKRSHADADLFDQVLNSDVEDNDEAVEQPEASTSALEKDPEQPGAEGAHAKVLDLNKLAKLNSKVDNSGVVYISRIPPGMGPSKLKHLMSSYGETGRVYLARDPKDTRKGGKKGKEKHQAHRFMEGWVEFMDKKVARRTAEHLNAQRIGGKKSDPFYDDIWTLKYLSRFKWSDLSASVAHQRAMEAALLRKEIAQSKKAQSSYLDQVDKARVIDKRREKQVQGGKAASTKVERDFKQRKTIKDDAGKRDKGTFQQRQQLDGVLSNLFG